MSNKKSIKKQAAKNTETRPGKRNKIVSLAQYEADAKIKTEPETIPTGEMPDETPAADGTKAMSLLDAAAHILSLGTGDPMRCKDIVDLAVARSLWAPRTGKTPASTLYAAILREITTQGDACRFVKTERGKFALADSQYIKEEAAKKKP